MHRKDWDCHVIHMKPHNEYHDHSIFYIEKSNDAHTNMHNTKPVNI